MMTTDLKTRFERIPLEILSQGKTQLIDELFAPEYVDRTPQPDVAPTREGFKRWVTALRMAFPDIRYTVEDSITSGDKWVGRVKATGTMTGTFAGMPATNKHATWNEIHILRVDNEHVLEHWGVIQELSMLVQLGAIPAPGRVPAAV
jgi:predicted ester cyclase